jgi:pimeloyl-ACP methyl ester carboxylesterase
MTEATAELRPPSQLLTLTEGIRALGDYAAYRMDRSLLRAAPKGDGHPVLVIPGFMADDSSTAILRNFLIDLGYEVYGWGMGRNLGPKTGMFEEHLAHRLDEISSHHEEVLSIVGQSLGGVYAREIARREPQWVKQVITLGSPFAAFGGAARFTEEMYETINGQSPSEIAEELIDHVHLPPPVPNTSIYSKLDGIVAWEMSVQTDGAQSENIEVVCSHCGMGFHPHVLYAVADRLAQDLNNWAPFDRKGILKLLYPTPVPAQ